MASMHGQADVMTFTDIVSRGFNVNDCVRLGKQDPNVRFLLMFNGKTWEICINLMMKTMLKPGMKWHDNSMM